MRRLQELQVQSSSHTLSGGSVTLSISHNLWATWASLAVRHEGLAWAARKRNSAQEPDLGAELREALLAITAAAFALDGFYGAIRDVVRPGDGRRAAIDGFGIRLRNAWRALRSKQYPPSHVRASRATTIFEAVKRESTLPGKTMNDGWLPELRWLFGDPRTKGVHHRPKTSEGSPHPSVKGLAADEYALYCAENATRAVDLMLNILDGCLRRPKAGFGEWASRNVGLLANLETERRSQEVP